MKLSIITINKDNAEGLRRTMESVLAQTCKDFEYIVVDGASTDGSVQVMEELASSIQAAGIPTDAVSEPDTGLYNAMNKGVRKATGEYTLMLNSGDWFVDEHVVEKVLPQLDGTDIIQGNVIKEIQSILYRDKGYGRSDLSFRDVMDGCFVHQASFIKRSLCESVGYYDDSYRKGGDTYFFIKALGLNNASFRYIDFDVSFFDTTGISNSTSEKWLKIDKEEDERFFNENIPHRLMKFYQESDRRFRLYDTLKRNKAIWIVALLLAKLSSKLFGPIDKTVMEKLS